MGGVLRWGAMFGGLLLFGLGLLESILQVDINSTAIELTPEEFESFEFSETPTYVRTEGSLDLDHLIYETGYDHPQFTTLPTDEIHRLPSPASTLWSDVRNYEGNVVELKGALLPLENYLYEGELDAQHNFLDDTVYSVQAIGTTAMNAGEIVVFSPEFPSDDHPDCVNWWKKKTFSGQLCTLQHLDERIRTLDDGYGPRGRRVGFDQVEELATLFHPIGIELDASTLVLVDTESPQYDLHHGSRYAPLIGTNGTVYVRVDDATNTGPNSTQPQQFEGLATLTKGEHAYDMRRLSPGHPTRTVVLEAGLTPDEYLNNNIIGIVTAIGAIAFVVGIAFVYKYDFKKSDVVDAQLLAIQSLHPTPPPPPPPLAMQPPAPPPPPPPAHGPGDQR